LIFQRKACSVWRLDPVQNVEAAMDPDIGIKKKDREKTVEALCQVLADTYALYQKTHLYHWNVQGPRFSQLHTLFEGQYAKSWAAIDLIAERVRALGALVPAHAELAKRATVAQENDPNPDEEAMLRGLLQGQEAAVKSARACLRIAQDAGDESSADLMTERCAEGEKAAWMLRAHLTG
jgi:starvation-inducible DNA-binding protein